MNLSDFNNLDFNNIASWPLPARAVAVGLVFVLVIGAGYWFDTRSQLDTLHDAQRQEQGLKSQVMVLAGQAANLEAYKKQLVEIKHTFGEMLQQLPNRTEVAGLLVDISQAGLASGLEFELFKPEAEIRKEF
ncbi:MAG: type 4a pilus biogenesis protein PilO, partial [Gammaproteobacteria bacterium]|nr:type 4a pilus biogenesis protein PilO [Gammaproteobacteria bacterium]